MALNWQDRPVAPMTAIVCSTVIALSLRLSGKIDFLCLFLSARQLLRDYSEN